MIFKKYEQSNYFGKLDNYFNGIKYDFSKLVRENKKLDLSEKILSSFNSYSYSSKKANKHKKMIKTSFFNESSGKLRQIGYNVYNYKNIPDNGEYSLLRQILTKMENKNKTFHSNSLCNAIHTNNSTQESVYKPKVIKTKPQNIYKNIFIYKKKLEKPKKNNTIKLIKRENNNNNDSKIKFSHIFQKLKKEEISSIESKNLMIKNMKKFNLDCKGCSPIKKEICGRDYIILNGKKIVAKKWKNLIKVNYSQIKNVKDIEKKILNLSMNNLIKKIENKMKKKIQNNDTKSYLPKMYKTNMCISSFNSESGSF